MDARRVILICPLYWGLGHASRDIPVIRRLLKHNYRVIVAGEQPVLDLVSAEFPCIETELLQGKHILYSKGNSQTLQLLRQLPSALLWVYREKKLTAELVKKYNPVCIISDNRYGVRHPKVKSVIITHQLMLKLPRLRKWFEKPVNSLIKRLVSQFDLCWIPDNLPPYSLAGDLAHKYPLPANARFTGALSRFMDAYPSCFSSEKYDVLVIISGPEPQRTLLQTMLIEKLSSENVKCLMVAGTLKEQDVPPSPSNIKIVPHLESSALAGYIANTPIVISRSGYTTIMDLWFLQKSAVLIPTPGQTEQEYLAKRSHLFYHTFLSQHEIASFNFAQSPVHNNSSRLPFSFGNLLDKAVEEIANF
ncbi:MAG: hypothetical protein LBV41_10300 [Cytophagaceae bacterium]|jgi:predicted glycosyltransferase|nr:hypothetical protein [Cytophagaceae bacterium]